MPFGGGKRSVRGDAVSFSSELLSEVARLLSDRVAFLVQPSMRDVLVLGSRDGNVTARVRSYLPDGCVIYQCDVAYSIICTTLQYGYGIVANDEHLPFKGESFDFVVSNLVLHNVTDHLSVFRKTFSILRCGSVFVAALLGSKTLLGIKKAMIAADGERIVPRIQSFSRVHDVIDYMHSCGFADVVADMSIVEMQYRDLYHLFRDMKDIGEESIFLENESLSEYAIGKAWDSYKKSLCMELAEVVPVQFEIILVMGKKK